ncbi:MAG: hypothetical protein ABFS18_12100 [Thermodesulfobacteriota bacterium]
MKKPVSTIVTIFLIMIALLHVLRLLYQVNITVGDIDIPMWPSIFGSLVPAGLAVMLKKESNR